MMADIVYYTFAGSIIVLGLMLVVMAALGMASIIRDQWRELR